MIFEDNFVYPFPETMYDPILKVRVHISSFRDADERDVPITIYYDPEIRRECLTVPISAEIEDFWQSKVYSQYRTADGRIRFPFKSDKEAKIISQICHLEVNDRTARIKVDSDAANIRDKGLLIRCQNIPGISEDPLEFLLYVYESYIYLSGFDEKCYKQSTPLAAQQVEICLSADAFLNGFQLSPSNYAQVEPDWYRFASRELVR